MQAESARLCCRVGERSISFYLLSIIIGEHTTELLNAKMPPTPNKYCCGNERAYARRLVVGGRRPWRLLWRMNSWTTPLQQLRRFIVQGYLKIEPATSKEVQNDARSIRAKILSCPMDVPNPLYHSLKSPSGDAAGNNLLHVAHSEMIGKSFLDSPELVDTLSNLLGLEYRVHPHSRTHLRDKGAETTMWHVDIHKGAWSSQRYHEPHYVIVSYYPQDTTIDMGRQKFCRGRNIIDATTT